MSKKKIITKEGIIDRFLGDLNHVLSLNHLYLGVLILSMYSEHIVDKLIEENFGHDLEKRREMGQDIKLKLLHGSKVLADSEYRVLNLLRRVRNDLVHEVTIDLSDIENRMKNIEINYVDENAKLEIAKWGTNLKFFNGCVAKIFYLLKKAYKIPKDLLIEPRYGKSSPLMAQRIT